MSASKAAPSSQGGELLLEVRSEEIPARMLAPATKQLASRLFEDLTTRGLAPKEVETGSTPRRLVVILRGFGPREPDREEQLLGPPARVAFDDSGAPTKAALGFAKRCGVEPEALERVETAKGEYLAATQKTEGKPVAEVFAEIIPGIVRELHWAKNMRWGTGEGPWVRPVHGVVALCDGEVLSLSIFGVEAGRATVGHPVLSPQPFDVEDAASYKAALEERGIEVGTAARAEILGSRMRELARAAGGTLVEDPELLIKLASICEIPGVLEGRFDEKYLELPREVLIASLKDHQSAFTVEREGGGLLPVFLTVMDRADDPDGNVRSGNEWVVAARLEDGLFFFREDRRHSLRDRLARLDSRTFHVKLGSYGDKAKRLSTLAGRLCEMLGRTDLATEAEEAALLLKADLSTEMVGEFASLQGVMGGVYGELEGLHEAVWQGIYDHYLPASTDDPLPRGEVGRIAGLADRLDTLVGIFGLGLVPTGSKDPFGLRRGAQGLVRILLEGKLSLDVEAAATVAIELYGEQLERSPAEILGDLLPFVQDRIRFLLGRQGYAYDEIEAAMAAGSADLPDLAARADAVHRIREKDSFLSVALSAKRIANIVKDQPDSDLDPSNLEERAEKDLHEASRKLQGSVAAAVEKGDYLEALERVAELAPALDRFFDDVMVMVDDEALRLNRVALLQEIGAVISRTADLTELVVDKAEHRR